MGSRSPGSRRGRAALRPGEHGGVPQAVASEASRMGSNKGRFILFFVGMAAGFLAAALGVAFGHASC